MPKKNKTRVSKSVVDKEEARAVSRVILEDGYLGMGKEVQKFEEDLQKFLKTNRKVTCVNSGTAALHLAVASITEPGDEVLVQSITYLSSFQAISAAGAVPVACEINPKTMTIDLKDAEKRITTKTKVIMPVHYSGDPGNLDEIYKFAKKHNLRVIEDAAHAFGTLYNKKLIGSFGDIVCFSFDGIKNITSGEGGAVVTADLDVSQYIQDARLLGVQKDTEKRYKGLRSWKFDVTHQGYRYHQSNLFAAIGRVQLRKFSLFKKARQSLAKRYFKLLRNIKGIEVFERNYDNVVPHIFPIKVLNNKRDELRQYLSDNNIESGIHYYPNHLLTYYRRPGFKLPITEKIYSQLLTLPLHPDLTKVQQDNIVNLIKKFIKRTIYEKRNNKNF